jgi:hypothetical protein
MLPKAKPRMIGERLIDNLIKQWENLPMEKLLMINEMDHAIFKAVDCLIAYETKRRKQ